MKRLISLELFKLRTTPASYVSLLVTLVLTVASVLTTILRAGRDGAPALGTVENVGNALSVAALTSMVMMAVGILLVAGEYRHRTVVGAHLGEPRRERVLLAKLATATGLGAVVGALTFGLALAIAVPMYAAQGVDSLPVEVGRLWVGATLSSAAYGLLGVALGALTRNTVGAIIGALVWVQVIEAGILQGLVPDLAKWLPTGAGVALTSVGQRAEAMLAPGVAALVLVGWAALLATLATRFTLTREVV